RHGLPDEPLAEPAHHRPLVDDGDRSGRVRLATARWVAGAGNWRGRRGASPVRRAPLEGGLGIAPARSPVGAVEGAASPATAASAIEEGTLGRRATWTVTPVTAVTAATTATFAATARPPPAPAVPTPSPI